MMANESQSSEVWWSAARSVAAADWVRQSLASEGVILEAELKEVQLRPWAVVLCAPSPRGAIYFKASKPSLAYEAPLTAWLADRHPRLLPEVLAVEPEEGWLLLRTGGARLRDSLEGAGVLSVWNDLLPAYAGLQESCMPRISELLAIGVPDRRPATLPGHVIRWRKDLEALSDRKDGFSQDELGRFAGLQPEIIAVCEELETIGPRQSINHGDLHDGNVLWLNGRYRIFDWGDCSLTHPFFTLRTTFVRIENRMGWEQDDPRFKDLRRRYLDGWFNCYESDELERAFELASMVWSIVSALNWEAAIGPFASSTAQNYEHVVPSLMRELIEAMER